MIDLQAITVSGAADIETEKIKTDQLDITFCGAGQVSIDDLDASTLYVLVSGAGDVNLAGRVESSSQVERFWSLSGLDLESQKADVTISGAGGANVWVTESLDVSISGAGDVKYYGSPSVTPDISGVGRIQSQGENRSMS